MVAGLAREVADALTVLQDLHAITVDTADDGSRSGGTKAARRNARLVLERCAKRHPELFGQVLTGEHRGGLEYLELAAGVPGHRRHLLEVKFRIDRQLERDCSNAHRHLGATGRVPV